MKSKNRSIKTKLVFAALALALLIAVVAATAWYKLFREVPQEFANAEERFKYGSIGTEESAGVPYWIWVVLPRVFPEYLPGPGGYTSLGVVWEEGHEMPVGFSKKLIGFERVGINCALCHSASYRLPNDPRRRIAPGGPATCLSPLEYQRFLFKCASDKRFTADTLLQEIYYSTNLSPLDRLLYRYVIIPRTRDALVRAGEDFEWTNIRPDWGRGRIDPFNPVKFGLLKMDPSKDNSIGNSDMEPIWNQSIRKGHALHWDGLDDSLREVVLSGALGDGATPHSLPVEELQKLEAWLSIVKPPKYPFDINWALVPKGQRIFQDKCATCHAGKRTGQVVEIAEVGTDLHRLQMWTTEAADRYNAYAQDYPWKFTRFRKLNGYVAVPLDGIWLRAPYLHNGSVPTLEALLSPETRPSEFYRGCDLYDTQGVGFLWKKDDILNRETADIAGSTQQAAAFTGRFNKLYSEYRTSAAGNSSVGHDTEPYGTELPTDDKKALIEFLKTL